MTVSTNMLTDFFFFFALYHWLTWHHATINSGILVYDKEGIESQGKNINRAYDFRYLDPLVTLVYLYCSTVLSNSDSYLSKYPPIPARDTRWVLGRRKLTVEA